MSRATCAEINLHALQHNLQVSRSVSNARQMAIIKANGYGHGIIEVARALLHADAYGVATVDEGITLREAGICKPIVLLEGIQRAEDCLLTHAYKLDCVVYDLRQVDIIKNTSKPMRVWLKLDSGMHRLGFSGTEFQKALVVLSSLSHVEQPVKLMTHLACADDRDSAMTIEQIKQFDDSTQQYPANEKTIANSAGILAWPQSHRDWVRPGIMLYGVSPFISGTGTDHGLQPVMTLRSELIAVNEVRKGETIGYGAAYRCEQDMTIGVVAIGYGDGYPRHARFGTPILVNQQQASLVGRVSMDMITVDLGNRAQAKVGDPVVLWGEGLPVEVIAEHSDTIAYELLCGVTRRVPAIYQ